MSQLSTFATSGGVLPPQVPEQFTTDAGIAIPVANNLNIFGGNNIHTTGAGATVTINVSGTTNHAVQVGNATGSLTSIAVGATGQVLTGVTGADPVFAAPAAATISITGDTGGALVGNAFTFTGGTTGIVFNGGGTTETLGGTLVVANGGTGRATLTNHGLLVGAGTAAITQLADATNGQLPIGSTGADPVLATITAGTGISITNGAGSITIAADGSVILETLTGNSGGAVSPTAGNINIVGDGTTVNVVGNPGTHTLTISAVGTGTVETLTGDSGIVVSPTAGNINVKCSSLVGGTLNFFGTAGPASTLILQVTDSNGNTAVGGSTLSSITSGTSNTFLGFSSGTSTTSGTRNIGIGAAGLGTTTTGTGNIGIGNGTALGVTGSFNIGIGDQVGGNYATSESSNILLNATSTVVAGESHTLRIGNGTGSGTQQLNAAFISGITGVNVGSTASVVTMGTGGTANKLGTATITAGSGISVTPGANTITIANTASSAITITGDSGGGLTGSSFTFTGGSTGLTFAGAGTTETLGGTLAIAHGGTNATSMATTDGVVYYDGTRLVTTSAGTAGQVLTSNGAGVAPTYQAAASGAMVLIQTQNPSGSSAVTFTSGISSTYSNYIIIISNYTTSGSGNLILQFSSNGGSSYIATGYASNQVRWSFAGAGNIPTSGGTLTTGIILTEANTGYFNGGTFDLWNITNGAFPSVSGFSTWTNGGASTVINDQIFGSYNTATAMNALQLIPASGTLTGRISLYGIAQ